MGDCGWLWAVETTKGGIVQPLCSTKVGGDLSQYQRNRSEDSGHPVGHRPGYSPIFLALTRLSYPFYPAEDNRGSPK